MKARVYLIQFILIATVNHSSGQEFNTRLNVYYSITDKEDCFNSLSETSSGKANHKFNFLKYLRAGYHPGEIHFRIKGDEKQTQTKYVKIGDGYFPRQTTNRNLFDTLRSKTLIYIVYKPVFQIHFARKINLFIAPEARIFLNASRADKYDIDANDMAISFYRLRIEKDAAWQASLGAEAGMGYRVSDRAVVQLSTCRSFQFTGKQGFMDKPCVWGTVYVKI
jgi:hypothetical protein